MKHRIPFVRIQKHAIIWVARPFGGKDTQTDAFKSLGLPVYHSGDSLAEYAEKHRHDTVLQDRQNGALANDELAVWLAKIWIVKNVGEPIIHLNGAPRSSEQLVLIKFLIQRGFTPKIVWFTTPEAECLARPSRPNRAIEDAPNKRIARMRTFDRLTAPMLPILQEDLGFSISNGNLLMIDNTSLTKEQTGQCIINFLGLNQSIKQLFPPAVKERTEERVHAFQPHAMAMA